MKKKTAEENLSAAAGVLSEAVLRMCKRLLKKEEGEPDPKVLKDVGSAIKEAVNVVTTLGKKDTGADAGLRIVFDIAEEFTE